MKINEKNLCAYAISSSFAADKEGYLMKKGEVNKGFQKRWFVLKGNLLFYFEKRYDKEPLGVIILEGYTIELDENDAQFSFKIVFHGMGNRSYILCAESQETMEQWMKSLACASYDYMKLMVTDLQRQLKETRCNKVPGKTTGSTSTNPAVSESTSFINQDPNGCEMSDTMNHLRISQQNANSSPHPPPRNRQNLHHKTPGQSQSSSASSQLNVNHLSKSKTTTAVMSGQAHSPCTQNSSYYTFPNPRNKIIFNSIHNAYGRPILKDRNVWRYKKRDTEGMKVTTPVQVSSHQFTEPSLLISL